MSRLPTSCIRCGKVVQGPCDCQAPKIVNDHINQKKSRKQRGYNYAWEKLSLKARRLQPFCSDCNTTDDLQADHTPEAWERHEQGLPIRLQDIDVTCGPCNRRRGAARGERMTRHKPRRDDESLDEVQVPEQTGRPSHGHTEAQGSTPNDTQPEPDGPKSTANLFSRQVNGDADDG